MVTLTTFTFLSPGVEPRGAVSSPDHQQVQSDDGNDTVLGVNAKPIMQGMVEGQELYHTPRHTTQPSQQST